MRKGSDGQPVLDKNRVFPGTNSACAQPSRRCDSPSGPGERCCGLAQERSAHDSIDSPNSARRRNGRAGCAPTGAGASGQAAGTVQPDRRPHRAHGLVARRGPRRTGRVLPVPEIPARRRNGLDNPVLTKLKG